MHFFICRCWTTFASVEYIPHNHGITPFNVLLNSVCLYFLRILHFEPWCSSRVLACNFFSLVFFTDFGIRKIQFGSVVQLFLTLCDPMDCSTLGFPVHHWFLEIAQTHVHRVRDAIQPSHPMSSPSPAFSLSQHQCLSPWVNSSDQVAKVLEFQLQHQSFEWIHCNSLDSFQWIIRTDFF